jgi:hypothetical protein
MGVAGISVAKYDSFSSKIFKVPIMERIITIAIQICVVRIGYICEAYLYGQGYVYVHVTMYCI